MSRIFADFPLAFALLLGAAGVFYMLVMGHHDPLRLAAAGLTGAVLGLAVMPVLARAGS